MFLFAGKRVAQMMLHGFLSFPKLIRWSSQKAFKGKYVLRVKWKNLEAHTIGFIKSPQHQDWKKLLPHFYDPFPDVKHLVQVELNG